jgi:hypothetical protein
LWFSGPKWAAKPQTLIKDQDFRKRQSTLRKP